MLDPTAYQTIQVEKREGVAVLTLNRPERLNAVNGTMHAELVRLFLDIQSDTDVRAAVLTGAGRSFCAGGDFSGDGLTSDSGMSLMQEARRIVDNLLDLEKPIVAALNGAAVGLGATIALTCDVVYAARSARIGDPHVRMGITAGDGGAVIWPLLIGANRAKEYLMTGDLMSAEQAQAMGLVNHLTEDGEASNEGFAFAKRLADGPAYAIQSTKVAVNKTIKAVSNLVLPVSLALEQIAMTTEDHREAVRAFQEKREPRFTGR